MLRLPAEWEAQDAILLSWPHNDTDWATMLDDVQAVYLELVRNISRYQKVILVAPELRELEQRLELEQIDRERLILVSLPTNDTWTRDCGPITVLEDGAPKLLDFGFNGWGLKFACDHDNQLSRRLQQQGIFGATPLTTSGLILEGGSLESDGLGTLLTTSQCLLEANRNPQLSREEIEQQLAGLLGISHFLWLEHGYLAGDDTDSHIDTLARLAPDDSIVYVRCDQPDDEHYRELQLMEAELQQLRTRDGRPFKLLPLPWPEPCFDAEGDRLPATYANYLVLNGAVLVPTYGMAQDAAALEVIALAHPGREVIGIDCRPLIEQHGSLHCITMQIPQGVLP